MICNRKFMTRIPAYIFLVVTFSVLFSTCEYGEEPYLNSVNVRVLNEQGFYLYRRRVMLNVHPDKYPDDYGYCKFNNVSLPYTLILYEIFPGLGYSTTSIQNLSLPNPVFCFPLTDEYLIHSNNSQYFCDKSFMVI